MVTTTPRQFNQREICDLTFANINIRCISSCTVSVVLQDIGTAISRTCKNGDPEKLTSKTFAWVFASLFGRQHPKH